MSDLCEFSDLPTDQCACEHCADPEPGERDTPVDGPRFSARFDSECDWCDSAMHEGSDTVCRTPDGDYICKECAG